MTLSVDQFYSELRLSLTRHLSGYETQINEMNSFRLKARVNLSDSSFIDIFFGARKNRIDFALICDGKRVFGIDNLYEWHCHPFDNENEHSRINPMSIDEIVIEFKKIIQKIEPQPR